MSGKEEEKHSRRAVMGVEAFAHNKGHTKALKGFRERKERKKLQTSQALRAYKKVMKQEGFEPGTGASRKRKEPEAKDEESSTRIVDSEHRAEQEATSKADPGEASGTTTNQPGAKKQRTHRFQKSQNQAAQKKESVEEAQRQRKRNERERKSKLRDRRLRTKCLSQRTRKGQPIMKNMVEDILQRLQKDKEMEEAP